MRPIVESKLSIQTKILMYKSLLRSIWAYTIQIWDGATSFQTSIIQNVHNILPQSNNSLHKDLKI